jgi:uncharacterized protein with beta-barrel porin domain
MNNYEVTGGLQKTFCNNLTAGIAGSYEYDRIRYHDGGTGKNSTWFTGLYGLYRPSNYYGLVDLSYGVSSNKLNRSIKVGSLHYKAHSKPKVHDFNFYAELGVDYNVGCFLLQPFAGIETGSFRRSQVTERETHGFGLKIKKKNWTATNSRLGIHVTQHGLLNLVEFSMDLAWNHLLSSRKNSIKGRFIEFGSEYKIKGVNLDLDSIDYALTVSKNFCNCLDAYIEFNGEAWKRASNNNIVGGIVFSW